MNFMSSSFLESASHFETRLLLHLDATENHIGALATPMPDVSLKWHHFPDSGDRLDHLNCGNRPDA
jgi:hypothetical protein